MLVYQMVFVPHDAIGDMTKYFGYNMKISNNVFFFLMGQLNKK